MKNTAKLTLAGLMLAITFTATQQKAIAGDIVITKSSDHSSPVVASFRSPSPISLADLATIVRSAVASLL